MKEETIFLFTRRKSRTQHTNHTRSKRSFLLVEVLLALSLVSVILIPCIYFYASIGRTLEEDLVHLQIPAAIDTCFFQVHDTIRASMPTGRLPSQGAGTLNQALYSSQGVPLPVPYAYSVHVRQRTETHSGAVQSCLVDVVIELFPNQKQSISMQRSLCVTS